MSYLDTILLPSFVLGLLTHHVGEGEKADLYIWCNSTTKHKRNEYGGVIDCGSCVYSPTPRKVQS